MNAPTVTLRPFDKAYLPLFFVFQKDPEANRMAAFTSKDPDDRAAFDAHWEKITHDPNVSIRVIMADKAIAGSVCSYVEDGHHEVTYWLGREYWGKGIATSALKLFIGEIRQRPLYARTAKDNARSLRVLEKCGFLLCGTGRGYANAGGQEIDEVVLRLD